jgi:hypothetical protein
VLGIDLPDLRDDVSQLGREVGYRPHGVGRLLVEVLEVRAAERDPEPDHRAQHVICTEPHAQRLDTAGFIAKLTRPFQRRERLAAGLARGVQYGDGSAMSTVIHHRDERCARRPNQFPFGIGGTPERVAQIPAPHCEVVVHRPGRIWELSTLPAFVIVLDLLHQRPNIHSRQQRIRVQLAREPFQIQRVPTRAGVGGKAKRGAELVSDDGGPAHRRVEDREVLKPVGE